MRFLTIGFIFLSLSLTHCSSSTPSSHASSMVDCRLSDGPECPAPGPGPSPIGLSNWSLYATDATNQTLWGVDITNAAFKAAWMTNGLYDNTILTPIGGTNWTKGINYLKSDTFKKLLPSIGTYTCYDRKKVDQFNRALNGNCTQGAPPAPACPAPTLPSGVTIAQSWGCAIYAKTTCTTPGACKSCTSPTNCIPWTNDQSPSAANCCVYQGSDHKIYMTGTCSIQNQTQEKDGVAAVPVAGVADACYSNGTGPNKTQKNMNGFYCSNWVLTTINLAKTNLQLKNLYGTGEVIGCMSPSTVVNTSTQWGGLGLGDTCTFEDPSVVNVGAQIPSPTYLDPAILYANPYNNNDIAALPAPSLGPSGTETPDQYSILHAFNQFCSTNQGFCVNSGAGTPGLAHLIGQAGPISLSQYVTFMKKNNPTSYYTWQYDDAAGQIVCDKPNSNAIAIFCPTATDLTTTQIAALKFDVANRFAVYNNCPYDIWVQMEPRATLTRDAALCQPGPTAPNLPLTGDCLVHLASGDSHTYSTPQSGRQSMNIWSKTGCDSTGFNCKTGEIGNNGGYPLGQYGAQPDIETKVEATFGCTLADTMQCAQTQNGTILAPASYFDVSFVDGFTRTVRLQMVRDPTETNASCKTPVPPVLDLTQCPTQEDLSTRP